jgi:PIN like domain
LKTPSGANLIARPEATPTFYVDESIFSNVLVAALSSAGIPFDRAGHTVPFGAPDDEWLSHCGRNRLVALTRDQRIRYRPLEKQALVDHRVACFTFTQGQATAADCAARIITLAPKMLKIAASQPRPFLYTFGLFAPLAKVRL